MTVWSWVFRVARVLVGVGILFANAQGGTLLGFYPPVSAEMIGWDVSKIAFVWLALWLIYRGVRPAHSSTPAN